LQPYYQEFRDKGFGFFAITLGGQEDIAFLREVGAPGILVDPGATSVVRYGVSGIPRTIVVDGRGVVYRDIVGWGGEAMIGEFLAIVDDLTGR
jgi:hypothetical protein